MMKRFLLLAVVLAGLALPGRPAPAGGWQTLEKGLEYRVLGDPSHMHQLRLDPARYRLGLLLASDQKAEALTVETLLKGSKALAAVNGGYFGAHHEALGYLREGSRVINSSVATGAAFTGVFSIGPQGARVQLREDFRPGSESLALQCGPRLVAGGEAVSGIHADPPRRRTGVGMDRQGRLLLYATDMEGEITFAECQKLLLGPEEKGGLNPLGVLNLDGGSSTQLSIKLGKTQVNLIGPAMVPVALGVFRRP